MMRRMVVLMALSQWAGAQPPAGYEDRVHAAWLAQVLGANIGFAFEHKPAAVEAVRGLPAAFRGPAPVDDDYYYELVALRAFERYGKGLTVKQLGEEWKRANAGSWGSSEQTRLLLAKGIEPPETGHPRYNKLWFTIGPQFSAEIYGMLAPGHPNLAARMAREYGHINGYAEGVDGAVFVAGMVSLAFSESDPREIVKKAAQLIDPRSPYRQCLDLVIKLAGAGKSAAEVAAAVEDRWHIEYPATNNAVANGGIVALSVYFGEGDFLKTINLAMAAADYTDADCNAASAAAVVGAMKGTGALPTEEVEKLGDRIRGDKMGPVTFPAPVDESISDIARRTAKIGIELIRGLKPEPPRALPLEKFELGDLMRYWNPAWTLERAGFGGAGGGLGGVRGITFLDGEVLTTWPRDEVRGLYLSTAADLTRPRKLKVDVAADAGRAWRLEIYCGNRRLLSKVIEGGWRTVEQDLPAAGRGARLRLYQLILIADKIPGNAYWRGLRME